MTDRTELATVRSTSPLMVQFDADTASLPASRVASAVVSIGSRVLVLVRDGSRLVVIGVFA